MGRLGGCGARRARRRGRGAAAATRKQARAAAAAARSSGRRRPRSSCRGKEDALRSGRPRPLIRRGRRAWKAPPSRRRPGGPPVGRREQQPGSGAAAAAGTAAGTAAAAAGGGDRAGGTQTSSRAATSAARNTSSGGTTGPTQEAAAARARWSGEGGAERCGPFSAAPPPRKRRTPRQRAGGTLGDEESRPAAATFAQQLATLPEDAQAAAELPPWQSRGERVLSPRKQRTPTRRNVVAIDDIGCSDDSAQVPQEHLSGNAIDATAQPDAESAPPEQGAAAEAEPASPSQSRPRVGQWASCALGREPRPLAPTRHGAASKTSRWGRERASARAPKRLADWSPGGRGGGQARSQPPSAPTCRPTPRSGSRHTRAMDPR